MYVSEVILKNYLSTLTRYYLDVTSSKGTCKTTQIAKTLIVSPAKLRTLFWRGRTPWHLLGRATCTTCYWVRSFASFILQISDDVPFRTTCFFSGPYVNFAYYYGRLIRYHYFDAPHPPPTPVSKPLPKKNSWRNDYMYMRAVPNDAIPGSTHSFPECSF